jgi:hypothetical protein
MRDNASRAGAGTRASDQQKLNWSTSKVGVAGFVIPAAPQASRAAGQDGARPAEPPWCPEHHDTGGAPGRSHSTRWSLGDVRMSAFGSRSVAAPTRSPVRETDHFCGGARKEPFRAFGGRRDADRMCLRRVEGRAGELVPDAERPVMATRVQVHELRSASTMASPGPSEWGASDAAWRPPHLKRTGSVGAPAALRDFVPESLDGPWV